MKTFLMAWIGISSFSSAWAAIRQELSIYSGTAEVILTKKDLLQRHDLVDLQIPLLNYPDQQISIKAIPIKNLLQEAGILDDHFVLYKCRDGFSGVLDRALLLLDGKGTAKAFLAIETDEHPWPTLPKSYETKSAGPFYLVWQNPQLSNVPPEYWPYQLESLRFELNLKAIYPLIYPKSKAKDVLAGFKVFRTRCMACHTINHQGTSRLGPDLNLPMNPVEYFKSAALIELLKNPASVREWKSMKMNWVDKQGLDDSEAQAVVAYLADMAKSRIKPANPIK